MSAVNGSISRSETLSRAQNWVDRRVPYSRSAYTSDPDGCRTYRQDCSGYVSMAWHLGSSLTTTTIPGQCTEIAKASVQPGDALWKPGHIVLVASAPSGGSVSIYQERQPGYVAQRITMPLSNYTKAYRYARITADSGGGGGVTPGDFAPARIHDPRDGKKYFVDMYTGAFVHIPNAEYEGILGDRFGGSNVSTNARQVDVLRDFAMRVRQQARAN